MYHWVRFQDLSDATTTFILKNDASTIGFVSCSMDPAAGQSKRVVAIFLCYNSQVVDFSEFIFLLTSSGFPPKLASGMIARLERFRQLDTRSHPALNDAYLYTARGYEEFHGPLQKAINALAERPELIRLSPMLAIITALAATRSTHPPQT